MGSQNRIAPKRSLGQNFFTNEQLIKKIISVVLDSNPKHITEIGSGRGAFTKVFYDLIVPLTLVEKDLSLSRILIKAFPKADTHNMDFLDFILTETKTTYFGSLPFNVSDEIINKILESDTFTNPAFFIIQKEVAEKYKNKKNNSLGLITQIYADCEIIFDIKAGNFNPKPNVNASFIKFVPHSRYKNINKQALRLLIKRSFKQPRKTLKNNLKGYHYKINKKFELKRAHELNLDSYIPILEST